MNLDLGSKTCPVIREGRGVGEGLANGNITQAM